MPMSRRQLPGRMARICSSNTRTVRRKSSCPLVRRLRAIRREVPRTSRWEPRSSSPPHKNSRMDRSPHPTSPLVAISILPSKPSIRGQKLAPPHSITFGAREQGGRDIETERLGDRQIDNEVELGRLLDWNVGRLRPAQNLVDEVGSAAIPATEVKAQG